VVDFLAGEEKTTYMPKKDSISRYQIFPDPMLRILGAYLEEGGNLLLSGAHIASDMHLNQQDSLVASVLKYKWRTSNASRLGEFYFMDPDFADVSTMFTFNAGIDPFIYTVEGADALEPSDSLGTTLIRYSENNMSAAVGYSGVHRIVALGFPFETIKDPSARDTIMRKTIEYLLKLNGDE